MNPLLARLDSFSLVLIVLGVGFFIAMVVVKALEHEREMKRMKLEADLKMKLAENFDDPEIIERIANLQVLHGGKSGGVDPKIALQHEKLALEKARLQAASSQPKLGLYVLPGLLCLLLGVGFWIVAATTHTSKGDDLLLPAGILGAVGLALLSYAVFLQDMAKRAYDREQSAAALDRAR